jgi:hypothetical protein
VGSKPCHLLLSGLFPVRPVPSQSRPPHVFGVVTIATTLGRINRRECRGPIVPSSNHQLQLPFTEQIRRYLRRRHFSHTNHIFISHNAPTSAIYTESLVLLGAASARETTGPVDHALDCLWQVCLFHACVVACANQRQILSLSIGRPPKIMQSTMAVISLGTLSYVTPLRITRERPQGSRRGQGGLPLATAANCSLPKKVSMTNAPGSQI